MHRPARLVLASNNPGKLRELSALLAPLGIEVLAQSALGIGEAEEPHLTFIENALAKARHASSRSGLPALADDSGLCVDALGGAPGIRSARLAGGDASDADNNRRLLDLLVHCADRRAHYYCVLVLVRGPDDPQPLIAEGEWAGEILRQPRGAGGFGYDPLFWLPESGCTSAELPAARKNELSHRAIAVSALVRRLRGIG